MRYQNVYLCLGLTHVACAAPLQQPPLHLLQAESILEWQPSTFSSDAVTLPTIVRYVKKGDLAPSCAVLRGQHREEIVKLISPEPRTGLPACAAPVRVPVVTKVKGSTYVMYTYRVEDPWKEFTEFSTVFKVSPATAIMCTNEAALVKAIEKMRAHMSAERALAAAIQSSGCQPER